MLRDEITSSITGGVSCCDGHALIPRVWSQDLMMSRWLGRVGKLSCALHQSVANRSHILKKLGLL